MKNPLSTSILFLYTLALVLVPASVFAQPKGVVAVTLEWHSNQQVYTYVFVGVVSRAGKPCPNAKIQLQFSAPGQSDMVQETVAAADGTYEIKIALNGTPQDSADWKLVAQGPDLGTQSSEVEGRTILME